MYFVNVLTVFLFGFSVVLGAATINKNQTSAGVDLKKEVRSITGATVIADRTKYPFQASLQLVDGDTHKCAASLIDNQNLLTSAYCLHDVDVNIGADQTEVQAKLKDAEDFQVVLGVLKTDDTSNNLVKIPLKYIFIYEDFSPSKNLHDIAVIRMAEEVKLTNLVNKVDLATSTPATDTKCEFSGWAYQSGSFTKYELASIVFTTQATCSELTGDHQFCGSATSGTCSVEPGSPIICNGVQAGMSGFNPCFDPITDVSYYSEWIEKQQKRSGSSSLLSSIPLLSFCVYACLYVFRSI